MKKGRRRKNDQHQVGELFAGTPGLMAMRTLISRAMTRCEDGTKRSIMLADVKTASLYGDARRCLYVELPPEDRVDKSESLNEPCAELMTPR